LGVFISEVPLYAIQSRDTIPCRIAGVNASHDSGTSLTRDGTPPQDHQHAL